MKKLFVVALSTLCFILIATISCLLYAKSSAQNDPQAKILLDKVSQKFKSYKTVKADFTLTTVTPNQKDVDKQSGKVYIKGTKYKISTNELDRLSDGKTVWTVFKNDDEVQINNVNPKGGELTPAQFFTLYQKGFTYSVNNDNAKAMEIDLVPTDKSNNYIKVRLTINKQTNMINSATIFEKSGIRITYTLQNIQPNTTMSDVFFSFNRTQYPDVEIIDLR